MIFAWYGFALTKNMKDLMDRPKRWQLFLIVAVILLTVYNILPTIFFYTKPLKEPVNAALAQTVAEQIEERVHVLAPEAVSWVEAFSRNLKVHPRSVQLDRDNPQLITVAFDQQNDASIFRHYLPRAGSLIPFAPAQLALGTSTVEGDLTHIVVDRQLSLLEKPRQFEDLFIFSMKRENGKIAPFYRDLVYERVSQLAHALGGPSATFTQAEQILGHPEDPTADESLLLMAGQIVDVESIFGLDSLIARRYFASYTQGALSDQKAFVSQLAQRMSGLRDALQKQQRAIKVGQATLEQQGQPIDPAQQRILVQLDKQILNVQEARRLLIEQSALFVASASPWSNADLQTLLHGSEAAEDGVQTLVIGDRNPFVQALAIDWGNDRVLLQMHPDTAQTKATHLQSEEAARQRDRLQQLLFGEMARLKQVSDEEITPYGDGFAVALSQLTGSQSLMALKLGVVAQEQAGRIQQELKNRWKPYSADLAPDVFPVWDFTSFKELTSEQARLGLVVYAPAMFREEPAAGFRPSSLYVIARGAQQMALKYNAYPDAPESKAFSDDFQRLAALLQQIGFFGYPGSIFGVAAEYSQDYIFELPDYYATLLAATREDFHVRGTDRYAILEFTDGEQRLLTTNRIDRAIHEDLMKWADAYQAAQVDLDPLRRYEVPPPTQSVFWSNVRLSAVEFFRGDDRKILRWGMDLSGGKTVRIGLRDQNGRPVTDEADLRQGVNELTNRVNKMGLSEVAVRVEGSTIVLEFPGSQALSASELVKASSMTFHIVNEKYSNRSPEFGRAVNQFLQDVWNEAVVTNRQDVESINEIAWRHLGGSPETGESFPFRSESARLLHDGGLRVAEPRNSHASSGFDDTLSAIALLRGEEFSEWQGQPYPLLIVFYNYALEGSDLQGVQTGYDPSKGNILEFGVRSSYTTKQGETASPRDALYTWTSQYSQEKIVGTPNEAYTGGNGWRMAVILNDRVISSPRLTSPLRDQAMISGHFSQREVSLLAADLKAGSLSFTPRILSEENISPDLGQQQRHQGILAGIIGCILVVGMMLSYYRFSGLIAAGAVVFNLLILWAVLQNLQATLTLPGIAAIVLTIGMAVDANVLVFERMREEFAISGRLGPAIQAGYRKAFSAIIDSNLTTILAALILLNFDSGPIRGFAVTLIIGIVSSMFTALFMTRYFFARWVQNPEHKELKMSNLIGRRHIDFLGKAKAAILISLAIIIIGAGFWVAERGSLFGMDFTGGYSLRLDLEEQPGADYRQEVTDAFVASGAAPEDFQVRELNAPNRLLVQFARGMENSGKPFQGLSERSVSLPEGNQVTYPYQTNAYIVWVVQALDQKNIHVKASYLPLLESNWHDMSGQLSDTMRNQALIGLALALMGVLLYITFRFEFKYAISAVIGLVHDVIITLGILALLHWLGVPVAINLPTVGAIMTLIGYSLNDTIIIFDRIREELKLLRRLSAREVVNHALNATLGRTVMTSGTTLLALVPLIFLGGEAVFNFSLIMVIGVVVGTFSSLFVAAPLMLFFHGKESNKQGTSIPLKEPASV